MINLFKYFWQRKHTYYEKEQILSRVERMSIESLKEGDINSMLYYIREAFKRFEIQYMGDALILTGLQSLAQRGYPLSKAINVLKLKVVEELGKARNHRIKGESYHINLIL
jgi:hypothetical protein